MFGWRARLLIACCLCLPAAAAAEPVDEASRAAAREIGYAGVEAYRAGDYVTANERLNKAFAILRAPSLGLWSARALAKLGRLIEAEERYLEVDRLPTSVGDEVIQAQARLDARQEALALAPRIPKVIVRVEGAAGGEVAVTIDDVPIAPVLLGESRPLNPGRHVIIAVRGTARTTLQLTLEEAARETAVLRLVGEAPASAAAPAPVAVTPVLPAARDPAGPPDRRAGDGSDARPRRVLATAVLAAGGVALVAATLAGVAALDKRSDLSASGDCAGQVCLNRQAGAVDSYNSLRRWSSAGFVAGAVLAATGIVILATSPRRVEGGDATVGLRVGVVPGGAFLRGDF